MVAIECKVTPVYIDMHFSQWEPLQADRPPRRVRYLKHSTAIFLLHDHEEERSNVSLLVYCTLFHAGHHSFTQACVEAWPVFDKAQGDSICLAQQLSYQEDECSRIVG